MLEHVTSSFYRIGWILLVALSMPARAHARPGPSANRPPEWARWARRLTGESAFVRSTALRALEADPELDSKLTRVIERAKGVEPTTEWFLALDAVSALRRVTLRETLYREVAFDDTGYAIHTLNTLVEPADYSRLARTYRAIVDDPNASSAARVSALDALARLPDELPETSIDGALESEDADTRDAAIAYVRTRRNAAGKLSTRAIARFVSTALLDPAPAIRARALYFISERLDARDVPLARSLRRPTVRARLALLAAGDHSTIAAIERSAIETETESDSIALSVLARDSSERLFEPENASASETASKGLLAPIFAFASRTFTTLEVTRIRWSGDFAEYWAGLVAKSEADRARFEPGGAWAPGGRAPTPKDLVIVYGYKDARPARFVADRYEKLLLIARIERPCRAGETDACGFHADRRHPETWFRAPDRRIRIVDSSAGADDVANRKDAFQVWKSARVETIFATALRTADAVFYNGHSRAGGGPDFNPPILRGDDEVDFSIYRRDEPGLRKLLAELAKRERPGGRLGLFSCASGPHFARAVAEVDPRLKLILSSRLLYFSDALPNVERAIADWAGPAPGMTRGRSGGSSPK